MRGGLASLQINSQIVERIINPFAMPCRLSRYSFVLLYFTLLALVVSFEAMHDRVASLMCVSQRSSCIEINSIFGQHICFHSTGNGNGNGNGDG